jgi:formyl-CoA transferase
VCGPIYSIADIYDDPHYRERDMILVTEDQHLGELTIPGFVPKLDRTPGALRWTGPARPGAHNEDVYGELLGFGPDDLRALEKDGLI